MNEKLKSRKFIVWITSTIFIIISLILSFTNNSFVDVLKIFAEDWGLISAFYIGGNVLQKFKKGGLKE
jgi:hypothetical protein